MARAYQRATRGITVAMGMVIPGLMGYFLDKQLGTKPLLTILGFGLGVTFGIWELVQMTRPPRDENSEA
jgi:F0F1-type ATP synthase assembly protein I